MTTNLKSKTLIANWVEERQCAHLEGGVRNEDGTLLTKLQSAGHKGILSTAAEQSSMKAGTTVKDSYQPPSPLGITTTGRRQELLKQELYAAVSAQVHEEFNPPPPPIEYSSTTTKDFSKGDFTPTKIPPTQEHSVYGEQPVSYWTQNQGAVTGVSQVLKPAAPFAKNTAFSTPIEEYRDQPKPHGIS